MPSTVKSINDSEKEAASQKVTVRTVATEKTERAREMKEEKKSTETGAQLTPVESLSYDDLADKCRLLADDCLKKEKQIEQLENDINTKSTDALNQARADLNRCKLDLENAYKLLKTKNDEIESLQTQNNVLNNENVELDQNNAKLTEDNGCKQNRITTLEQQLEKAENEIKKREETIDRKHKNWEQAHNNWEQAQTELEEAQNELEKERAKPILTILKERCENRRKSRGRVDKPKRQRRRWSRPSFSSIKKPLLIALIVLAILSVIVIPPACLFTDPVYHANVDRINIGDDKDRVLRVLGAPDNGNQGSKHFEYYSSDHSVVDGKESGKSTKVDFNTQGFVTELVYDHDISNASKPIEKVETEYEGELRAFAETLVKYTVKYDDKSIYKSSVKIMPDNNGNLRDVFEYTFTVDDAFSDTPIEITLDVYNDVAETVRREGGYLRVYKDSTGYRVSSIGDYVLFGEYPQTIKSDDVEVGEVADKDGYYLGSDGCRYAKVEASGGYVIEFSNGDEMKDETYYFKVEPICWRICENGSEEWYLLCDSVIDYRQYHSWRGNGYTDQSNNYKNSDIRKWLNDDFYNVAFTLQQQEYIAVTEVDNSVASTGYRKNPCACENTYDKIFLPSYAEIDRYDVDIDFAHYASSVRNDHNLALGNMGSNILLRSPYDSILSYVRYIGYTDVTDSVRVGVNYVDNYYQIVPALNLKWNKSAA